MSLWPVFLPEELVGEVLSFLPVKTLLRLRCVSKSLKSIISDPTFVKRHLNRSALNEDQFTVVYSTGVNTDAVRFTVIRLLENPPIIITLPKDPYHQLRDKDCFHIVGSCNGLLCLLGTNGFRKLYLRFWNPATRTISEKLGYSSLNNLCFLNYLTFGYHDSTDTYKVAYFIPNRRKVRLFSLGHNVWRNIQKSPVYHHHNMNAVHLSGRFIWLGINNQNYIRKKTVIISLDLGTEIHTQLLPPKGIDDLPFNIPNLIVLKDCLCFCHDFKQTHFVLWQMKEFGVEDSWTQFLKISYHNNLQIDYTLTGLLPLCLSEKNDTLLLTDEFRNEMILYNWRDNRVERVQTYWPYDAIDYIESLVWYC